MPDAEDQTSGLETKRLKAFVIARNAAVLESSTPMGQEKIHKTKPLES